MHIKVSLFVTFQKVFLDGSQLACDPQVIYKVNLLAFKVTLFPLQAPGWKEKVYSCTFA